MPHNGYTGLSGEPRVISLGNYQFECTAEDALYGKKYQGHTGGGMYDRIKPLVKELRAFMPIGNNEKPFDPPTTVRGPFSSDFRSAIEDSHWGSIEDANDPIWYVGSHPHKPDDRSGWYPNWHRDFGGDSVLTQWMLVWANLAPTEVLLPNHTIFVPPVGEAVVVNNLMCRHRCPLDIATVRDRRAFIRISDFGRPIGGRVLA